MRLRAYGGMKFKGTCHLVVNTNQHEGIATAIALVLNVLDGRRNGKLLLLQEAVTANTNHPVVDGDGQSITDLVVT